MSKIHLTQISAAKRQLDTAIELWFYDGDPVSTHALACNAYQIVHDLYCLKRKSGKNFRTLLFDTDFIKKEHQKKFVSSLKRFYNFIKHADSRQIKEKSLDFDTRINGYFILYAIHGISLLGETHSDTESVFLYWILINRSDMLSEQGHAILADKIPIEHLEHLRNTEKRIFYDAFLQAVN